MTNRELVKRSKHIADNYNTLYLRNETGRAITDIVKIAHRRDYTYGKKRNKLEAANKNMYSFGNVEFITALLNGWDPDASKSKARARKLPRNINNMTAKDYIDACDKVSDKFDYIEPGELLWTDGCLGVYIGDGLGVSCIESWSDGVQIVGVMHQNENEDINNIGWKKHGKLPWVKYEKGKARSYTVVAKEVIEGSWGVRRDDIIARLTEKGYNSGLVMHRVDEHLAEFKNKTLKQIAAGVVIGKWGETKSEQNKRLMVAGYDPARVMLIANKIKKGEPI